MPLVESAILITDSLGVGTINLRVCRNTPDTLEFWKSQSFMIGHCELIQYRDPERKISFRGALSSDFSTDDD